MTKILKKIDTTIEKTTSAILVVFVLTMLFLSSAAIILRWFHINLTWVDPLVRHLVFLCAFLGGVIATGRGTHIGIDVLGKFFEAQGMHKAVKVISKIILLASILVLAWLLKSAIDFTIVEMEYAKEEFLGISSAQLVGLIPIGVSLLLLRFTTIFLLSFQKKESV